jgi:hypothetical protein
VFAHDSNPILGEYASTIDISLAREGVIAVWAALDPVSTMSFSTKVAEWALTLDFSSTSLTLSTFLPVACRADPSTFMSLYYGVSSMSQFMSFLFPHFGVALAALFNSLAAQRAALSVGNITDKVMLEVIE